MEEDLRKEIVDLLKNSLTIHIDKDKSCYHTTDGSTRTHFTVTIKIDGETISSDSYYD